MKTINNYIQEKLNLSKGIIKPKFKDEIQWIIKERLQKDKNADLNDIDVSGIKDMSYLFTGVNPHNIDISEWDVSNVKNMFNMFNYCDNFNCDLSEWDVSNVTNMGGDVL